MKSSESETQHGIHKIYSHFIETPLSKSEIQHGVRGTWKKGELSVHLWENFIFLRKDFSFVVNFVNSSKSETQYGVHKIYSHVIETPPSKSKTQHGVHIV